MIPMQHNNYRFFRLLQPVSKINLVNMRPHPSPLLRGEGRKFLPLLGEGQDGVWFEAFSRTRKGGNLFETAMAMSILFCSLIIIYAHTLNAQDKTAWRGKQCAVSLTYDDALNVHLDNAVPILDSLGFKATFYLSGFFPAFRERSTEWKSVAANGHELGNHTLFHPCDGTLPGRGWVKPDYDLSKYTMRRLVDEISMANILLRAIDGKTARTFAYPCGEMSIGGLSYVDSLKGRFSAARSVEGRMETIDSVDRYRIGSYMVSGQSGDELINLVKQAMEQKALIVFLFHGVGGEHDLDVSLDAHRKLLYFLKQNERQIWVAPLVEIAEFVAATKTKE